jgi:hypothetical protein
MKVRRFTTWVLFSSVALWLLAGCKKASTVSAEHAGAHAALLVTKASADVKEVRTGLPVGAPLLASIFATGKPPSEDPQGARRALEKARDKVQELRVAKSTFFAVADATGLVIRNDQEQDQMAGKYLFEAFPDLKKAIAGQYLETRGSMPEAAGVKGRADGQWIAGAPVVKGTEVVGLYVTGWSWAAYAYRLENALNENLRSQLKEGTKQPLTYVYLLVDHDAFGTPISPEVNAKAIVALGPLSKLPASGQATFELEIDGREFGLGVARAPELGKDVAIAVLRSET